MITNPCIAPHKKTGMEQNPLSVKNNINSRAKINAIPCLFSSIHNTWVPLEDLIPLYEEALKHPKIEGLVIPTRPVGISCQANQKEGWST